MRLQGLYDAGASTPGGTFKTDRVEARAPPLAKSPDVFSELWYLPLILVNMAIFMNMEDIYNKG